MRVVYNGNMVPIHNFVLFKIEPARAWCQLHGKGCIVIVESGSARGIGGTGTGVMEEALASFSSNTLWTWLSYVPCKQKMAVHWSLGFAGFIQFHSHAYSPHFDSFWLIPFFFYIHIPNFLYAPLPNSFYLIFYSFLLIIWSTLFQADSSLNAISRLSWSQIRNSQIR